MPSTSWIVFSYPKSASKAISGCYGPASPPQARDDGVCGIDQLLSRRRRDLVRLEVILNLTDEPTEFLDGGRVTIQRDLFLRRVQLRLERRALGLRELSF